MLGKEEIILELYDRGIIQFGDFVLSSGKHSSFYINLRILPSFPRLFKDIVKLFIDKCLAGLEFDVVCGVATGGIPFAAYISFFLNKPLAYVRKERKSHGLKDLVVGIVDGKKILVVDDVATTGGSLIQAIEHLKRSNGIIMHAGVLVLRSNKPLKALSKLNVKLAYLLTGREILKTLLERGKICEDTYNKAIKEV